MNFIIKHLPSGKFARFEGYINLDDLESYIHCLCLSYTLDNFKFSRGYRIIVYSGTIEEFYCLVGYAKCSLL